MGTFFLDNQDKNLLKVTFDIVSSIYYYLDTSNIELHSFISEYKKALKEYVYAHPDIPEIDDIKSRLVFNFFADLPSFIIDLNKPNIIIVEKIIETIKLHKCDIGLIWFYDSLPRVDASFANLEMVNDFIQILEENYTNHLDDINEALLNDLTDMLELNAFDFGNTINILMNLTRAK